MKELIYIGSKSIKNAIIQLNQRIRRNRDVQMMTSRVTTLTTCAKCVQRQQSAREKRSEKQVNN